MRDANDGSVHELAACARVKTSDSRARASRFGVVFRA